MYVHISGCIKQQHCASQLQKGEEFMTTAHICIMIAIIVYLGAMLFVGYLCSKQNNDTSDFYQAGLRSDLRSVHTLTGKS